MNSEGKENYGFDLIPDHPDANFPEPKREEEEDALFSETLRANMNDSILRAFTKLILDALSLENPENTRDTAKLVLGAIDSIKSQLAAANQKLDEQCHHTSTFYDAAHDNFYCGQCKKGMGVAFYEVAKQMEKNRTRAELSEQKLAEAEKERDALRVSTEEDRDALVSKWLKDELSDYAMVMDHLTETYCHFSGGRISKPNTKPFEVFAIAQEIQDRDIQELRDENAALRKAVEPFAKVADWFGAVDKMPDTEVIMTGAANLTLGDFLQARAALTPTPK